MHKLNVVSAQMEAALRSHERAAELLESAARLLDRHVTSASTDGENPQINLAIIRVRERLKRLDEAQAQSVPRTVPDDVAPPRGVHDERSSRRVRATLFSLGSSASVVGLGASSLIIVGAIDLATAQDQAETQNRDRHERYARAALVTGSVTSAVFLAAGVTLLTKAFMKQSRVRRARSDLSVLPVFGPTLNGIALDFGRPTQLGRP